MVFPEPSGTRRPGTRNPPPHHLSRFLLEAALPNRNISNVPFSLPFRLSAAETDLESLPDLRAASHPEHLLQHRLDESRRRAARQKALRKRRREGPRATGP